MIIKTLVRKHIKRQKESISTKPTNTILNMCQNKQQKIKPSVKARDWMLSQTVKAKLRLKSLKKKSLKITMYLKSIIPYNEEQENRPIFTSLITCPLPPWGSICHHT